MRRRGKEEALALKSTEMGVGGGPGKGNGADEKPMLLE